MNDMRQGPATPDPAAALRELAEKKLLAKRAQMPEKEQDLTPEQARKLLHELQVHQLELEMQNEELRLAQAQLQASRARYQDLFDRAPSGYLTLDENGVILAANLTAEKLLEAKQEELRGQPLTAFILPEDQDIYYLHYRKLGKCGALGCELRLLRGVASPFWARLDSVLVPRDGGAPECRVTLADISARKKAEAEKQRLKDLLIEKRRELTDFIFLVTHDLRGPLINIQGFSHNLAKDVADLKEAVKPSRAREEARKAVESFAGSRVPAAVTIISENVKKAQQLLETLNKVYRLVRVELQPETVDAEAALKSALKSLHSGLEEAQAQVQAGPLPPCKAALGTLTHIFTNLLSNAVKYRAEGRKPEIAVRGKKDGNGNVVYSVSDNGIGIKEAELPKVFDIFYRGSVRGAEEGEGIGLSLARVLAGHSGGRIWAESREGKGSVFYVEMPA